MDDLSELARELQQQRRTLHELLQAARREHEDRSAPPSPAARKNFLALLSQSLDRIRQYRAAWVRLDPAQKQGHPEITEVLRDNQNLIMKILVLEREGEMEAARGLRGLQRPAPAGDPAPPDRPGASFLARAYRRNSAA
jgi:hypothetical protein